VPWVLIGEGGLGIEIRKRMEVKIQIGERYNQVKRCRMLEVW